MGETELITHYDELWRLLWFIQILQFIADLEALSCGRPLDRIAVQQRKLRPASLRSFSDVKEKLDERILAASQWACGVSSVSERHDNHAARRYRFLLPFEATRVSLKYRNQPSSTSSPFFFGPPQRFQKGSIERELRNWQAT